MSSGCVRSAIGAESDGKAGPAAALHVDGAVQLTRQIMDELQAQARRPLDPEIHGKPDAVVGHLQEALLPVDKLEGNPHLPGPAGAGRRPLAERLGCRQSTKAAADNYDLRTTFRG